MNMSTYYEILCEYYEHHTKANKAPLAMFVCGLERCMGMGVRRQRLLSRVLLCVLCEMQHTEFKMSNAARF